MWYPITPISGGTIEDYPPSPVLYVDDEPDARDMLTELLTLFGIKCYCARSAKEAWTMMTKQRFQLYVLDAWLPEIDGFEFCRQIRAIDLETPIVFYSGAAYESDKERGIRSGANAYIVKPHVDGLVEVMARLVAETRTALSKSPSTAVDNLMEANRRAEMESYPFPMGVARGRGRLKYAGDPLSRRPVL